MNFKPVIPLLIAAAAVLAGVWCLSLRPAAAPGLDSNSGPFLPFLSICLFGYALLTLARPLLRFRSARRAQRLAAKHADDFAPAEHTGTGKITFLSVPVAAEQPQWTWIITLDSGI